MGTRATTWGRAVEDAARAGGGGAIAVLAAWQGYRRTLGRRHDRWGASDEEVAMPLPGDDLVPDPAAQSTRAIGIAATPGQVWPWLVQPWAGGWYVAELVPEKVLVLQVADLEFLWTFALFRRDDGTTRLVVRERVAFGNRAVQVAMAPFSLVSFVLTRGMLLGIKQRAEAAAQSLASSRSGVPSVAFASSVSS